MKKQFIYIQKKISFAGCFLLVSSCFTFQAQAQFTYGNVVVSQVGNGGVVAAGTSGIDSLKEFNATAPNQAAPLFALAIPVVGAARLTTSAAASGDGLLKLSTDSSFLTICGYDAPAGVTGIQATTSAMVHRVVDMIDSSGAVNRAATTNDYNTASIRCAQRLGTNDYWLAGGNTGTCYFGNTAAPAVVQNTVTNTRSISLFNGNLYFSAGTGSPRGIHKIAGAPFVAGTATLLINTGDTSSPYDFAINAGETIAYVADDRVTGGIQKWVGSGATWSLAYTIPVGTLSGARGLIADFSGASPVIFATATDHSLVRVDDTGAASGYVVLATPPVNCTFRGVAFAPKHSPSTEGVGSINTAGTIVISPNPVSAVLHIDAPFASRICVVDIAGKVILQTTKVDIDVSKWANGTYLVQVFDAKSNMVKMEKVVVAK